MSEDAMIDRATIPALNKMFRFQWEKAQNSYVLLYPEGMIQLNGPAGEILALVDGERTVDLIIGELQEKFPDAGELDSDVLEFMQEANTQGWISL